MITTRSDRQTDRLLFKKRSRSRPGLAIGYGAAAFISFMVPSMPDAYIPGWAVMLSFGFTSLIGIVFGLAPAIKAARLNPIDALRYE